MKTKILIALFLCFSSVLFSQNTPFKNWLQENTIATTFITKSMLNMTPDMQIGSININELNNSLEQVEIYTNDKTTKPFISGNFMKTDAEGIASTQGYDLTLKMNVDNRDIIIYTKKSAKDESLISDFIMITSYFTGNDYNDTKRKCTIVRLLGEFKPDDIQKMTERK
ncbi:DUF4252 domain-containing protein [Prevotella sp. 10(H)]|uniref:DUF4252 domain-containing protein n=1 Tax=Prevotella sp. 10(H) TaxID=1158294 RepID=UPI0004A7806E|nr:DUF4252 domain-containing protein [Prevotella sp. 10(H)]